MTYDDDEQFGRAGNQPPTQMTGDDFRDYWQRALDDPDRIWPEDVLSEEECDRGWFDRQVIAGRRQPEDRVSVAREFGGDLNNEATR